MPNYDFKCEDCHQSFELRMTIEEMEKGDISCIYCKSKKVKRLYNGFGFSSGKTASLNHSSPSSSSCSSCSSGSCSTCR